MVYTTYKNGDLGDGLNDIAVPTLMGTIYYDSVGNHQLMLFIFTIL